jgi:hypothetical protein
MARRKRPGNEKHVQRAIAEKALFSCCKLARLRRFLPTLHTDATFFITAGASSPTATLRAHAAALHSFTCTWVGYAWRAHGYSMVNFAGRWCGWDMDILRAAADVGLAAWWLYRVSGGGAVGCYSPGLWFLVLCSVVNEGGNAVGNMSGLTPFFFFFIWLVRWDSGTGSVPGSCLLLSFMTWWRSAKNGRGVDETGVTACGGEMLL